MDPITARRVLRIVPDSPITVELVERAYSAEAWERHPSRYTDPSAQREAEEWAQTLATARGVLLTEAQSLPDSRADAATSPSAPRRRLSGGAIAGIVAGGVALIALVTFGAISAANLLNETITTATETLESEAADAASGDSGDADTGGETDTGTDAGSDATDDVNVDLLQPGETLFAFPAALEMYYDGRYTAECPLEHTTGCWEQALFPEAGCDTMQVQLGFTNDAEGFLPEHTEIIEKEGVVGNEATVVVFGNDDYGYGWINQVTCLDAS